MSELNENKPVTRRDIEVFLAEFGEAGKLSLAGRNLRGIDLANLDLRGINLRGANLRGADLSSCNLSGADLAECELRDTYLRDANLTEAILTGANLTGADLRGVILKGVKLSRAILFRADLSASNLRGVDMSHADLRESYLAFSDLSEADLTGADLSGADLLETKLEGTYLYQAKLDNLTISPASLKAANLTRPKPTGGTGATLSLLLTSEQGQIPVGVFATFLQNFEEFWTICQLLSQGRYEELAGLHGPDLSPISGMTLSSEGQNRFKLNLPGVSQNLPAVLYKFVDFCNTGIKATANQVAGELVAMLLPQADALSKTLIQGQFENLFSKLPLGQGFNLQVM